MVKANVKKKEGEILLEKEIEGIAISNYIIGSINYKNKQGKVINTF